MDAGRVILIVDDSNEDYEAMLRAFRRTGISRPVRRCPTGNAALDYLHRRGAYADPAAYPPPAVVLLDLNLPGIDGRVVLARIKADAGICATPVVVLSTSANPRDVEACYRGGANSYIVKPVDFDRLARAVRSLAEYWLETVELPH